MVLHSKAKRIALASARSSVSVLSVAYISSQESNRWVSKSQIYAFSQYHYLLVLLINTAQIAFWGVGESVGRHLFALLAIIGINYVHA